ncbi:MAG: chemotaxis protein CheX [Desulfococcaceae bacterium]
MMTKQIEHILWQVTEDVMGKLAFMFSYPDDESAEESSADEGEKIISSVSFKGLFDGKLEMLVSPGILPDLAGNMLGLDDGETATEEEQYDAIKELVNVICGNLLPEIAGKQAIFKVGVPQTGGERGLSGGKPLARVSMMIEDERCEIRLWVQGQIPSDFPAPGAGN